MILGSLEAFFINMAYLVTTLAILRLCIWYLNKSQGIELGSILKTTVYTNPLATAVYRGAVWIGACVVAASFLR